MKNPQKVPHADLIDDFEFMKWCDNNILYQYCDVTKWRNAYIAFVREDRTGTDASIKIRVSTSQLYLLVRNYKSAAVKYKRERDSF